MRYRKVGLKKSFDIFCEKLINSAIEEKNNAEDVLMLIQDLKDTRSFFDYKSNPKNLTKKEARSEVNKEILDSRVRHYIE